MAERLAFSTSITARTGNRIIGRGECYAVTRSVGFVRGIAHDGDPADPVANIAATFMFTSRKG
jgi:acyl-coenzyme A thioesterase PaaI-like protein